MTDVDATHIDGYDIVIFLFNVMMIMIFLGEIEIKYASPSTKNQDDMESHEDFHKDSPSPEHVSIIQRDGKVHQNV